MNQKIILGTVQLGVQYGINNSTGRPSQREAFNILDTAFENNIALLDSADDYGAALEIIGQYKEETQRDFGVINKFKIDSRPLADKLHESLDLLRTPSLYCYMYHRFSDYRSRSGMQELQKLKHQGLIEKIGLSVYNSDEIESALDDLQIDIIQLPANILDFDDRKQRIIERAKAKGKEIHARSIFLQGLFFKDPEALSGNIKSMRPYLQKVASISKSNNINLKKAALNFILNSKLIDYAVIGTETASQLTENLSLLDPAMDTHVFSGIELDKKDGFLLNPANWKL